MDKIQEAAVRYAPPATLLALSFLSALLASKGVEPIAWFAITSVAAGFAALLLFMFTFMNELDH